MEEPRKLKELLDRFGTAVLVTPFVWSYAKERHPRQALFFFSITALFVAGLAIRGMTTGS